MVSARSLKAFTEHALFSDVLHVAPTLLQTLCLSTLGNLSSASRELRCLLHAHVSSISIGPGGYGTTQYHFAEIQVLVNGSWPRLQRLKLRYWAKLETGTIAQLSKASWPSLTSLDLSRNLLSADAMPHLASGKWPALKHLGLHGNQLDSAATAWLAQADWPLEELQLSDNKLDVKAMENLIQGNWPLKQLTLQLNKLTAQSIAVLVKAEWPLQQLNLGHNELHDHTALKPE